MYNRDVITRQTLSEHRDEILSIAERHGASDVRVFGSVARGDSRESSDLDLIVRLAPDRSMFDLGSLVMDLQDLLGVRVDIVSEAGMRQRFRDHVLQDAVAL